VKSIDKSDGGYFHIMGAVGGKGKTCNIQNSLTFSGPLSLQEVLAVHGTGEHGTLTFNTHILGLEIGDLCYGKYRTSWR
jgi:hypothetical protein